MGRVRVKLPLALRQSWGGDAEVRLEAATLREALERVGERYPALAGRILDDRGEVRRHVHVFVNRAAAADLSAPLGDGDVVHVLPAVSGGLA